MSRYSSPDVGFLLIDGMNVLGDTTTIEDSQESLLEETTVLGDADEQFAAIGIKRYDLSQMGYYNDAANRSNAALITPGASHVLSFAPEGNTKGKITPCSGLVQVNYKRQISRGALHKGSAAYKSAYGHDEARIIHALQARTTSDDSEADSYDGLAASSAGGVAYLQVTDLTLGGYDDVTITVLHDADNSGSFSSLMAFTNVSTAPTGQRKEVAGSVLRYLAVAWAFNGAGSNPSITFMVGFARK